MSKNDRLIISVCLLVVLIGGASYYFFSGRPAKIKVVNINTFNGSLIRIEGESVTLHGLYVANGTIPGNLASERDLTFSVGSSTVFNKLELHWPDWNKLTAGGKTSGTINFSDMARVQGIGSLADLKNSLTSNSGNIHVEAKFSSPIQNLENPTAQSIDYEIMVMSPPPKKP